MSRYNSLQQHYQVLGIGFGPSNIALAIAIEEENIGLEVHFIEAAADASWQPGMLLGGSDIQNHPLRDLVTPRNPKSHYTFANYLKETGRLYEFLNLGITYPLRKDYSRYIKWAASHFDHMVSYGTRAGRINYDSDLSCWRVITNNGRFTANALVVAIGRSPNVPALFKHRLGPRLFHLTDYVPRITDLAATLSSVAVIGASQSAVEIHLDLMRRFPAADIHAIHRGFSMRQKDTSPFSDQVYFPEFIDYFFSAGRDAREDLQRQLRPTNYSSADIDVLHQLYLNLYEEKIDGIRRFHLHNNTIVQDVTMSDQSISLGLRERFLDRHQSITVDAAVLATGFQDIGVGDGKEPFPPLLAEVISQLSCSPDGALLVNRDYRVDTKSGLPLFLSGLCESSHGFGDAGSFSLLSLRASDIVRALVAHLGIRGSKAMDDS